MLGSKIADLVNDYHYILLNTGCHTRQNGNSKSAIDISLASPDIANQISWKCDYTSIGSDHFPINIKLNSGKNNTNRLKIKINHKNIIQQFNNINPNHIFDLRDFEESLVDIIKQNTTKNKPHPQFTPKYWWTEKIDRLWKIKAEKLRIFNKNSNDHTENELKKSVNQLKSEIKRQKKYLGMHI